jgi:hypothetical protein
MEEKGRVGEKGRKRERRGESEWYIDKYYFHFLGHGLGLMMQEHLSTSASQLASHASEFKKKKEDAKREAQPHLNLNSM